MKLHRSMRAPTSAAQAPAAPAFIFATPLARPLTIALAAAFAVTLAVPAASAEAGAEAAANVGARDASPPPAPALVLSSGIDRSAFDPAMRPQDDLYGHVNGHWLQTAKLPPDKAYIGVYEVVQETTRNHLRALVEAAGRRTGDLQARQIGDLYQGFMDEAAVERLGLKPLTAELATIEAVADRKQFAALVPHLARLGVAMPIGMSIGQDDRDATRYVPALRQGGLGLPNRDYYLAVDDVKFAGVRARYVDYLSTLLTLADGGDTKKTAPADARASATDILALETEIARVQWSAVENRDPIKTYNRTDLDALPALAPGIDWTAYLDGAHLSGKTPDVIVQQPSYFKGLGKLQETVPLATWKAYARTRLLSAYAQYLPKAFVDARFDFAGKVLRGTLENEPRWKRGVALVNGSMGEGLGRLYVAEYFPPESKRRMEELVANLLATYRESIEKLDWMSPATREQALAKLAKFHSKIGYPNKWIDYSTLEIRRDDLIGNVMRANRFEDARELAKLGKPIDREEWGMSPQTVNAYYDPSMNEIVFPAAFLQAPEFDVAADDAVNYGAIGMVIGHEISHGFDDQGSQYDGDGNLHDWWTADDKRRFAAKTAALVAQYNAFVAVPPAYRVNGELTLGENIADNAGLAIAWKAYQRSLGGKPAPVIDGMTGDQRFFYGFAQAWRSKERDDALLAQVKSDPHSPDQFRVIGSIRNHPGFYSTFGVKPGDKMYLKPDDRVNLW